MSFPNCYWLEAKSKISYSQTKRHTHTHTHTQGLTNFILIITIVNQYTPICNIKKCKLPQLNRPNMWISNMLNQATSLFW
jgi:hypothetical protein